MNKSQVSCAIAEAAAQLAQPLARVRASLCSAAQAAGRKPSEVRLVAATKHRTAAQICALADAGITEMGENYVQELVDKARQVRAAGRVVRWHVLGGLQRNKAAAVANLGACVHTVDRIDLLAPLGRGPNPLKILLQIRLGPHQQGRHGCSPDHAIELMRQALLAPGIEPVGLMGLPPAQGDPAPHFAALAALLAQLRTAFRAPQLTELSMGMSHDFSAAIAAGATIVRLGRALFGPRIAPGISP